MKIQTTKNRFLGDKLDILQFSEGFRGTTDTVLLAASVEASSGDKVLELGCGVGVALCCLLSRLTGLEAYGIEIDSKAAQLCKENLKINKMNATIINSDLSNEPIIINKMSFDHIFMNPPFYKEGMVKKISNKSISRAKIEVLKLDSWIRLASKRCRPKGKITIIQRSDRLPEILSLLKDSFGSIRVLPLCSFKNDPTKTVIVQATKGSKGTFKLYSQKNIHKRTGKGMATVYEDEFRGILWEGKPLNFKKLQS